MIKHVVSMKFNDKNETQIVAQKLRALKDVVPAINTLEVGIDVLNSPRSFDLVLITTHDDLEALKAYQEHPEHKKVAEYIHTVRDSVVAVDFEYQA